MSSKPGFLSSFVIPIVMVVLLIALQVVLRPWKLLDSAFVLYLIAVFVSVFIFGWRAGLTATAGITLLGGALYFTDGSDISNLSKFVRITLFFVEATAVALLFRSYERNKDESASRYIQLIDQERRAQQKRADTVSVRFQAICDQSPLGIFLPDAAGKCLYTNTAYHNISGMTLEQTLGDGWSGAIDPEDRKRVYESWSAAAKLGALFTSEHRFRRPDASVVWTRVVASPFDDAEGTGHVGCVEDVTDRRHADQELRDAKIAAEAANHAKSTFLANMSHEIRTPLTAIFGFADLLLVPTLSPSDRLNAVHTIRRSGEHLLTIINDILDLTKVELGKMQVDIQPQNLPDLLCDVLSLMRQRAAGKGLSLTLTQSRPLPQFINTDATRMRQILINLVGNAVKFTPTGSVDVNVDFDESSGSGRLQIQVIDTGIGIAESSLMQIFEPFTQADAQISRKFGGTGLGLSLSRKLAMLLNGDIRATSRLGSGSTFVFECEASKVPETAMISNVNDILLSAGEDASVPPSKAKLAGTVLVTEDSPDNQRLIRFFLENNGLKVELAENGKESVAKAIAALADGKPYDIILMDMQMPEMDGVTATSLLRSRGYDGVIIALTANAMAEDRQRCLAAGCDHFLTKPLRSDVFMETIRQYLQPGKRPIITTHRKVLRSELVRSAEFQPLLRQFIEELREKTKGMSHAIETQDLQRVLSLAHQIKGSAESYGFPSITEAARVVELAAKTGQAQAMLQIPLNRLCELVESATHD